MGDLSKTFGKLKIALLLLLAICFSALSAQAKYGGGTGEPNDPYLIFDANHLNTISADANDWDRHFLLCADVDLGGDTSGQFSTIGTSYANSFAGVFDGNNHIISNLRTGFFGIVVTGGRIKNLGLIDPNIGVNASLVDRVNEGTIENCYVQGGSVDGDFDVGGLVAMNAGTITSCYSSVSVWGLEIIGGLVGVNEGTITNCYSTGAVSGYIGVGGLCGANDGTITACYSISEVSGDHFIGGLVAMNWSGTITDCYSTGNLSGYVLVGGLVGENGYSSRGYAGTITNCYSAATFTGTTNVGGLVGLNDVGTITGSFWDTDISDVNNMCGSEGSGGSGCDNGNGKATAQMQTKNTFTDTGWDFFGEAVNGSEDIWRMCLDEVEYPRLSWEFYTFADFVCPDGVNFFDFSFFSERWAEDNCGASNDCEGRDLDQLGSVDINDLRIFADKWLAGL